MKQNRLKIIGLTGNSGSGKTTVSKILKSSGGFILDGDVISREVLQIGQKCYDEVLHEFGSVILNHDKSINRKALGGIVFSDKNKLKILTKITHRYIIQKIIDEITINEFNEEYSFIVVDGAVIIGTVLEKKMDEIWVTYADLEILINRIMNRDNLSYSEARSRIEKQSPLNELKEKAEVLIDTSNLGFNQLNSKVNQILKERKFIK